MKISIKFKQLPGREHVITGKKKAALEKIREIDKALYCECYHCALALALTLPDICGKIAYPELTYPELTVGERYSKWFDDHLASWYSVPKRSPESGPEKFFNGYACYLLRCAYLHSGNFDLEENHPNIKIDGFCLHFDRHSPYCGFESIRWEGEKRFLDLDAIGLCRAISREAYSFCFCRDEKDFSDSQIQDASWSEDTYDQLFVTVKS